MTARTKNALASAVLFAFGLLAVLAAFGIAFHIGRANAATTSATYDSNPIGLLDQLYNFIRTGKGTLAAGAVMTLLVWAVRNGLLSGVKFFTTKLGGYLLGFGVPTLVYMATALGSGNPVTLSLVLNAIAAGYVAAGGWEHLQDLFGFLKNVTPKVPPAAGATALVMIMLGSLACTQSCKPGQPGPVIGTTVIDCTSANLAEVAALFSELKPLVTGGTVDWSAVFQKAKAAGAQIGGCALTALVQDYLGGKGAPPTASGQECRATFEKFRAEVAGGATFHTAEGDL